jgi:hypothetical protein
VIQENKVLRGESNAFVIEHGGHRVDLMSFALSHQSESNRALNNKTSTPACNRFLYQDLTNNWNSKSHDNLLLSPLTGVNQTASRPLQLSALGFDFARVPIRPKLRVSQPGDVYEQEADSVAERVMTISEPVVQLRWSYRRDTSKYLTAQPKEKEHIQDKRVQATDWRLSSVSPIVKEVISSPGQPLDSIAREFMESRFGYDFGQIRIHADSSAAKSAEVLGADAYTFGTHIAFAQTHFPPSTQHGMILLAHELVHTIQQAQLPRLRPNKSRSTINPNIHEAWNLDKSIHIGTATPHIALGPKKKRVGQAAQGPKFVGMRLGLNDDMQEVKVKREVGSTQGYDDRLQAIAVARNHCGIIWRSILSQPRRTQHD